MKKSFFHLAFFLFFFIFLLSCRKNYTSGSEKSNSSIRYFSAGSTDIVLSVENTPDGGFIYCGYTYNIEHNSDAFLLRTDKAGHQLWYKTYGGKKTDFFWHAIQTSDGGFMAVGGTNSIGSGAQDSNQINYDYVVKCDADGNESWSKSYANVGGYITHVLETDAHDYIMSAKYNTLATANVGILKINSTGSVMFRISYGSLNNIPPKLVVSNYYNSYGKYLIQLKDKSLVMGGFMSKSNLATEASKMVTFQMHLNSKGNCDLIYPYYNYVREASYMYSNWPFSQAAVQALEQADGLLLATWLEQTNGTMCMQLLKTGFDGTLKWEKKYYGLGSAIFHKLEVLSDGNFLLLGSTSKLGINSAFTGFFQNLQAMILKVDPDGNEIWQKYIGPDINLNILKAAHETTDGGLEIAGYSSSSNNGVHNMFILCTDNKGNIKPKFNQ